MVINELMPGIWDKTPPMRWSIRASMVDCWAKSCRVAYACLGISGGTCIWRRGKGLNVFGCVWYMEDGEVLMRHV
jgi:hypothetical protein